MNFFTSDLHLWHKNIMKYCPQYRNFASLPEMHQAMLEKFNSVLSPEDTLYVLGDVGFCKVSLIKEFFDQVTVGRKILVRGNHDAKANHLSRVFDEIYEYLVLDLEGEKVNMSHFPYAPPEGAENVEAYDLRYMEKRLPNDGNWLLCGHVHEKWKVLDKMINVGVDQWDLTPISQNQVLSIIRGSYVSTN